MSRPLRHAPPLPNRGPILRPRLLSRLQSRFDRPLTAVVAAAGFGKTTLLGQAVAENALSPIGEDRWLTCQRGDDALSFLATDVFAAVGLSRPVPEDPDEAALAVADALWSVAPRQVALILDDAHLIGSDTPGWRFVSALVDELPRNGHLVLASRYPLALPTSRQIAGGDAVVLGEDELQFREDELVAFADVRGIPRNSLADVGGWPALAELTATAGSSSVIGYVWEELLSQLSPERRRALAVLVSVGGADDEIARALLGPEVVLEELLDNLPLVLRSPSGWWSLHALWASALQHRLTPDEIAHARRTAGLILRRRRQYHDAMDLLIDASAWDEVRELILDVCEVFTALVPPDVLRAWLQHLPAEVQGTPEGLLLAAMAVEPTSPATAEKLLEQAVGAAAERAAVRYACLNALVLLAFWRGDRRQMEVLAAQLDELAGQGHPEAPGLVALIRAQLGRTAERVRAELAVPQLASGAPLGPVSDWLHAHIVLLRLGDPVGAEPLARRSLANTAPTMQAVSRAALVDSLRLQGRLGDAEQLLPELLPEITTSTVLCSPELVTCGVVLLSILNRHAEAGDLLRRLRPTLATSPVAWAASASALAEAFHQVSLGHDDAAAAALRQVLGQGLLRSRFVVQVSPAALPLLYVLVPEIRSRWDHSSPPGCFAAVLQVSHALVELRERGSLAAIKSLPPNAWRIGRVELPIPWATELALGMLAAGHDGGRQLLTSLGQAARAALRSQANSPVPTLATAARAVLRDTPAIPDYRLRLRVLGPMELRRDGVLVTAPDLRRERVRQLLAHLVMHRRPTRSALMAELWPELDESAASRNLRVTLAYLQNVLEPDRDDSDPPYFVRSSGAVLHLVVDGPLTVDALEFEQHVEQARELERQGALSAALSSYQRAIGLWGGDYLSDIPFDDQLQLERERLRATFVTIAVRAGHLLLARGDIAAAQTLAKRALAADTWSETAHQLLIAAHLAGGDLVNAKRSLLRCQGLLRELGVPPQQQTLRLARQLHVPPEPRAEPVGVGAGQSQRHPASR
jgi:DNA-binding SARP family transcriptional activator